MVTQLTTVAMLMMCLTCLPSAVGGEQQATETIDELREELQRMAYVMSAAISRFEDETVALRKDNMAMNQNIAALEQDNSALNQNIDVLNHDNIALKQENIALKQDIVTLKKQVDIQNSEVGNLVDDNTVIKQKIHAMFADPRHDDEAIQVAFSVVSHEWFGPVSENTIIPFEITYVNVGSCWNPDANVFYALVRGVYMFTVSMRGTGSNSAHCDIVLTPASGGQTNVATMLAYGNTFGDAANSVILALEQGDVVYVQLRSSVGTISSSSTSVYSTFSGYLLFE